MRKINRSIETSILFLTNGAIATSIHYIVLYTMFEVLHIGSAGVSSLVASFVSSFASFYGNKHIVFRVHDDSIIVQATRFTALYFVLALFHGGFLLTWTDWLGWNYRYGFLLAVVVQIAVGYLGNKYYVFRR